MEVSGQIQTPAALTARKDLSVSIELEAVWTPEPALTVRTYGNIYNPKCIIADIDPPCEPAYYC
jgi:hypothetical protein